MLQLRESNNETISIIIIALECLKRVEQGKKKSKE